MLPFDVERCAGRAPYSADTCRRKNECARYLAPAGRQSPFRLSACEGRDGFIHAESIGQNSSAGYPAEASSGRVLDATALRTGGGSA